MNDLTILLTLKGRKKYTERWLDWMALEKCPYKILIADGDSDKSYTKELIKKEKYKDLLIDYREYPTDKNINTFIQKFYSAVSSIDTKYSIYADNDDFIIIENLKKAISYIKDKSDIETLALPHYRVQIDNDSDSLDGNLYANKNDINIQRLNYIENKNLLCGNSLMRLKESIRVFPSDYFVYAIHKTYNFKKLMKYTTEYPIRFIFFWERHFTYSVGINGGIFSPKDLEPFLARQEDTSMLAASLVDKERLYKIRFSKDWKEQYPYFQKGLFNVYKEKKIISEIKFNFLFRFYFGKNTLLRVFQGIFGSILRPFNRLYLIFSNIILRRLEKDRTNIDQRSIVGNDSLNSLYNFLKKNLYIE